MTHWLTDKALQAQMIEQKNSENPVVIYSKSYCPFSNQVLLSRSMIAGKSKLLMEDLDQPLWCCR